MEFYEGYKIIEYKDFIAPRYDTLGKKNKKVRYYNCESILDIETSHNHNEDNPQTWVYQWAWLLNDIIVIGREKDEIFGLMHKLLETNSEFMFRTFIHNLPYEFSYLWQGWDSEFGIESIMASNPRKPFRCVVDRMEFLCSYKMSNRSLSAWGKFYDVMHKKLDNAIDYNAINYPHTELRETDWKYMYHDVISPRECIHELMKVEGMRYDQLLMTSTMYVKNAVTKKYKLDPNNRAEFRKCRLSANTYITLRKSFVGGITHANWKILNTTVRGDIAHYDFNSHYPTQMITKKFPMGKPCLYETDSQRELRDFLPNNDYAYWCVVDFNGLRLRNDKEVTMPYISVSKCDGIRKCIKDNGRVVSTDDPFRMYVSSYDIKWILKQYTTDEYIIKEVYRSKLGKLPKYLTDTILECYLIKCELKEKLKELEKSGKKETEEYKELTNDYNKSKNILNGLYGVCATDPIRDEIEFNNGEWRTTDYHTSLENINGLLEKYYDNRNRWTRYEWGTWVTSLARDELMTCIELVGYDNYLYCDTDSIFFMTNDEINKAIEDLNAKWLEDSKINNYSVTNGTKVWYMHSFEAEPKLRAFRTLGAKCYAMEEWDKKINDYKFNCTIAGVPTEKSVIIDGKTVTYKRAEELGNIDNLDFGFTFTDCVPTRAVYTDEGCIILNSMHKITPCESYAQDYYTDYDIAV